MKMKTYRRLYANAGMILLLLALGGCSVMQKYCDKHFPPQTITETITTVEYQDTVVYVYVEPDTVFVQDTVYVEKETGLVQMPIRRLDTQFAYATAEIIDSRLQFYLYQKEQKIEQYIEDAIKTVTTTVTEKIPYKVNYLTWWQRTRMYIGNAAIGLLGAYVLVLLFRIKLSTFFRK